MKTYLENGVEIARDAGKIIHSYFDTDVATRLKDDNTPVTAADEEINAMVITRLEKLYPDMAIIGEEGENGKKSPYVWVCDPLDGTFPFTYRLPLSVFSLALVDDGKPIVGIIYDPFTDRMYTAEKGKGAQVNGASARVSEKKLGPNASIMMEWWGRCAYDVDTAMHALSAETGTYVLHLGSTVQSGCMVIRGVSEANVFPGTKGKFVDAAAMKIIVEEAGGRATDLAGNDQRYDRDINGIVLSNGVVHDEVLAYIKKYSLVNL